MRTAGMPRFKYVLKRFAALVMTFLIIVTLAFFVIRLMPGSPYEDPDAPLAALEAARAKLYLDKPVMYQYLMYLKDVITKADFGVSVKVEPGTDVFDVLRRRIPVSMGLNIASLCLSLPLGLFLGAVSALWHNKTLDKFIMLNSALLASVPSFVYASLLQYGLAFKLGIGDILYKSTGSFWERAGSAVLPVIALSIAPAALLARSLRAELVENKDADFMLLARMKGLKAVSVLIRHGLRNAMAPLVPLLTAMFTDILGGSLVIERIFGVSGAGSLLVEGINTRDHGLTMAVVIFYTAVELLAVLAADLLYGIIDPRVVMGGGRNE